MASEQCVLDYVSRALWDVRPTTTDRRAQQLAFALGYPESWRVVRTLEDAPVQVRVPAAVARDGEETKEEVVDGAEGKTEEGQEAKAEEDHEGPKQQQEGEVRAKEEEEAPSTGEEGATRNETAPSTTEATTATTTAAATPNAPPPSSAATTVITHQKCLVDRIYAGRPGSGCDMWFHHEAAMKAAETWDPEDAAASNPFGAGGGHLLPRQPLFGKGDKVQVLYENQWWDATILRRKGDAHKTGFAYGVHYATDGTKQSGVDESLIRFRPEAENDPKAVAKRMGLDGWEAYASAHSRYKIVAPNGEVYHGKKQAMEAYARFHGGSGKDGSGGGGGAGGGKDAGDPPWRRDGNPYVGRHLVHTVEHRASARRTVKVDQYGTVTGWINDTDVDRAGKPGFASERTGLPARLYHVQFEEVPHHPYASLLLDAIDLEEHELEQCLVEEEEPAAGQGPPKKKAKTGST